MNMKKWLALLLCLLMALSALTGCSGTATESEAEEPAEEAQEEEPAQEAPEIDYEALYNAAMAKVTGARNKYDPDLVVCKINGQEITWGLLYYCIAYDIREMLYYTGDLPTDFNEPLTETSTLAEYFNKSALSQVIYYAVAHAAPEQLGIPLGEEADTNIEDSWKQLLERYGTEEALLDATGLNRDLVEFIVRSYDRLEVVQTALYGPDSISDEDVIAWATEAGYVRTKHILYSFYNEDGSAMDDEGKAAQKARADEVWAELSALSEDTEALEKRFDEIMLAESGDAGGLTNFPDGYTFAANTMVPEYETAAFALADYGLSEVVETSYGYHILLRLPLTADGLTMDQNSSTRAYMTLRETVVNERFNNDFLKWIDEAQVEWLVPELENIDFNSLFDIVPPAATAGE